MRKQIYILLSAALLATACAQEDNSSASLPAQGWGEVAMTTRVSEDVQEDESDTAEKYYIPEGLIPADDDLKLTITGEYIDNESGKLTQYNNVFDNVAEFAMSPTLWSGTYKASLSCGKDRTAESETNACFGAESDEFTVVADDKVAVDMTVALVNSIIRLQLTEDEDEEDDTEDYFTDYFSAAEFIITTTAGTEFTFDPFSAENTDYIAFVEAGTTLYLSGTAERVNGSDVTFTKSNIGTAIAGCMNTIVISAKDVGSLSLTVTLNEEVIGTVKVEDYEFNPLSPTADE